jgi:hypothetical protein
MTRPIRISCDGASQIPSAEEIQARIGRGHHLVLQFPVKRHIDKHSIINNLAAAMPDYSVFDSGGDKITEWVTVMPVVSKATVLAHSSEIRQAVAEYIEACSTMLALYAGKLPAEWSSFVHGGHRRFENSITGQVVEAPLSGAPAAQEVDPYFFAKFVKSTAALESVAQLIAHDFHDAARMLRIVFGAGNDPHPVGCMNG